MRLPAALLLLPLVLPPRPAEAHPYAALRPSGNVLAGPTDGTLESLIYNPAALRLARGVHLLAEAGVQGYVGSYQRAAPLPAGFSPGSAEAAAPAAPISWAVPGYLLGASWDLGTETVSIGAAFYLPYADETRFAADDDAAVERLPTRYHVISAKTYSLWGSVGAGLRITSWLYLGGGFNFTYTRAQRDYLRDPDPSFDGIGCGSLTGCEAWERRQRLRLDVDGWGFGFSAGALVIPVERLWIGASFTSAMFTTGPSGGDQVALTGQPREGDPCPPEGIDGWHGAQFEGGGRRCYGGAELVYSFPYLVYLGGRLRLDAPAGPRRPSEIDVVASARLAIPSRHDQQLRLERRAFLPAGATFELPAATYLPTGEQTAVAIEVGVRQQWQRLQLGEAVLYESPRVSSEAVSPANIQGHRLDVSATGRLWLHRRLALLLSAGVTFSFFPDGAGGRLSPGLASECRAAGYDALSPACREVQDGWAQPPAAGRYQLTVPHGSAGIEVRL